ncbi:MAG: 2-succinyl-5-enolpyruvyl-6-hydroxy-3-cyclohexene-1-carboxylic-acid synthase [Salinivenus sp.]
MSAPLDAPNVTYLWAQVLIEELVRNGVRTFFVAPGSRSTPLTVTAARHPEAEVTLHVDERGGAFAALGVGRATQRPAAWITTSGTAVANGLPAVVEASMDGVPLLLLTADRPPELRDTGANQAIDQVKLFGRYTRWHVDLPPPTDNIDPAYVLTTVNQAVHRAVRPPAGPVHLNCGFRKPLEPIEAESPTEVPVAVQDWAEADAPFTEYPTPTPHPSASAVEALSPQLNDERRGLVVAGRLQTDAEATAARRLATRLGWPLIPGLTSRLRLQANEMGSAVSYADLVLASASFRERYAPEVVVHLGGRFVSKRLRFFLRESAPEVYAVVRPAPSRLDPDHRVTHHVESGVVPFVEKLLGHTGAVPEASSWRSAWTDANERAAAVVKSHAATADALTEPLVATVLTDECPPDHALVAASSMPVRDLDRHASTGRGTVAYANRGASGIDGTVATAAGVADGRGGPVTLLIGDLALWHDLNSLALLEDRSVVVVVVNNDGGGIFHFLPIRDHDDVFDPYFTTPHGRSFASAAATFGLPYRQPDTPEAFRRAYREACGRSGSTVLEIQTDREANQTVHEQLEQAVASAVAPE